jgi:hypothetical protein
MNRDILAKNRGKYDEERLEIVNLTLHRSKTITFLTTLLPETFPRQSCSSVNILISKLSIFYRVNKVLF